MRYLSLLLLCTMLVTVLSCCKRQGNHELSSDTGSKPFPESETAESSGAETDPVSETFSSFDTQIETEPETVPETEPVPETESETEKPQETEPILETTTVETKAPEPENAVTVSVVGLIPGTGILYRNTASNGSKLVCIDAGHQGKGMNDTEPNAPGSDVMKAKVTSGTAGAYTGLAEHELNLKVALCLRDILLEKGYSVLMVRESADVTISNAERAILANDCGASLLIRIHANGASDPSVKGAMTLCQTPSNPDNGFCYPEARRLSESVLSAFCDTTGMKYLYISETDTMTGINWCKVPATIIEMGFMSNKQDDRYMADPSFPMLAARGIAEGVDRYYE